MKKSSFSTFFLLLVTVQFLLAFPYQPFRKSMVHEYFTNKPFSLTYPVTNVNLPTKLILGYRIDSAFAVGNGDSLYVFNTTLNPENFEYCSFGSNCEQSEGIFGKKLLLKANGDALFLANGSKDTFLIKTNVSLNTSWILNKTLPIEATFKSKTFESFLGLKDSVMNIDLSNGLTIKIAKHYGIIKGSTFVFPKGYEKNIIESTPIWLNAIANITSSYPAWDIRSYFNYQRGDELRYYIVHTSCYQPVVSLSKRIILERLEFPAQDSLAFIYSNRVFYKNNNGIIDTTNTIDTLRINKVEVSNFFFNNPNVFNTNFNKTSTMGFELYPSRYSPSSKMISTSYLDSTRYLKLKTFQLSKESFVLDSKNGVVQQYFYPYDSDGSVICPDVTSQTLYYSNIGGKTYGDSTSRVLKLDDLQEAIGLGTKIFPNPTGGKLNVSTQEGCQIFITDVAGQMVYTHVAAQSESIFLEGLAKGLYFVRVVSTFGEQEVVKVLKE